VVATLGGLRDAQLIDALEGSRNEPFMLHYNFPPYCVGETGMVGSPKRREIGHGNLARRGIEAVLPSQDDFPYAIRVCLKSPNLMVPLPWLLCVVRRFL